MTDRVCPAHVAIVMDGNGRWAESHNRERTCGHRKGVEVVREIVKASVEYGVRALTLFTFSSENWKRPQVEVRTLLMLFSASLHKYLDELMENEVRLRFIGDRARLAGKLSKEIANAERATAGMRQLQLNIALSYGGRWDIAHACEKLMREGSGSALDCGQIEAAIGRQLAHSSVGDVDLLIRTGGENRLSNFLLWQSAYAELYFTDTLWPDFDKRKYLDAIKWFGQRDRKFGTVK